MAILGVSESIPSTFQSEDDWEIPNPATSVGRTNLRIPIKVK